MLRIFLSAWSPLTDIEEAVVNGGVAFNAEMNENCGRSVSRMGTGIRGPKSKEELTWNSLGLSPQQIGRERDMVADAGNLSTHKAEAGKCPKAQG